MFGFMPWDFYQAASFVWPFLEMPLLVMALGVLAVLTLRVGVFVQRMLG